MMIKRTFLLSCAIINCFSEQLFANLTTMQYWDPSPIYSANNYLMPPNSNLLNLRKARKKDMKPSHDKRFSIGLTGFVQAASRAYDWYGCNTYQSWCGNNSGLSQGGLGNQMGDFRGTLAAMPLFLGNDPSGNSIFGKDIYSLTEKTKSIFYDQTDTRLITLASIDKTLLPENLKNIAKIFSGAVSPSGGINSTCTATTGNSDKDQAAFLFLPAGTSTTPALTDTVPSVFSQDYLSQDTSFFGAFSLPLEYRKAGLRLELAIEPTDWLGLTIQTGFVNIQQTTTGLMSIDPVLEAMAQVTSGTAYATPLTLFSNLPNVNLYGMVGTDAVGTPPYGTSVPSNVQTLFDDYISNNQEELFDSENGIDLSTCNFDYCSVEDVRVILSFKHIYDIDRYTKDTDDEFDWPDMIFTPYAWIGASAPVAKKQQYNKLLSLPFGNNGHASVGGAVGFMFDFVDSIEVGFEGGATYFAPNKVCRPVPNHPLQRVAYPYWTTVNVHPGINCNFKAHMNAYQFINHVSFWATFEVIQHRKDHYNLCNGQDNFITKPLTNTIYTYSGTATPNCTDSDPVNIGTKKEQIFYPEKLSCNSDWRMQFLNMAVIFDIQPGMQAGFVWQQPISPRNAYYPVSLLATFNFMF